MYEYIRYGNYIVIKKRVLLHIAVLKCLDSGPIMQQQQQQKRGAQTFPSVFSLLQIRRKAQQSKNWTGEGTVQCTFESNYFLMSMWRRCVPQSSSKVRLIFMSVLFYYIIRVKLPESQRWWKSRKNRDLTAPRRILCCVYIAWLSTINWAICPLITKRKIMIAAAKPRCCVRSQTEWWIFLSSSLLRGEEEVVSVWPTRRRCFVCEKATVNDRAVKCAV